MGLEVNRKQRRAAVSAEDKKPNKVDKADLLKEEKQIEKEIEGVEVELKNVETKIAEMNNQGMRLKLQAQNMRVALATVRRVKGKFFKSDEAPTAKEV